MRSLPAGAGEPGERFAAEALGDSPELADRLAKLILSGTKTATCSALWEYEVEGEALPSVGSKCVLLDGSNQPVCVLETTEVEVRPFDQVDARFAHDEGEGDRTLEHWRAAHWRFFTRTLRQIGKYPTNDMPLVCERFQVVYQQQEK